MERVAFYIDASGEQVACLLNPEDLVIRRQAGLRERLMPGGALAGRGLSDDPVQFTGGGLTELELKLVFDLGLPEIVEPRPTDVRDLTGRLWRLTENTSDDGRFAAPPIVRLIWGKAWNIAGVIVALAERFDAFDSGGRPQRSWMHMRFRRVPEPPAPAPKVIDPLRLAAPPDALESPPAAPATGTEDRDARPVINVIDGERIDLFAQRTLGDPRLWRAIAWLNDLDDPLRLMAGQALALPGGGADTTEP